MSEETLTHLEPLARAIAQRLSTRPECFVSHPSELRIFRQLDDAALRQFARDHGWRVVRRIGGRQIEFYHDAQTRLDRARTGNSDPEDDRPVH